jgi:transcriptional regulator with XRE-family HTH domain
MKAIQRLQQAGMTRAEIAKALGVTRHAVGFWARGERSPGHNNREKLMFLADSRGILLLASDFSMNKEE